VNAPNHLEIEVKLHLSNPAGFEARLASAGAEILQPRTHEYNLRFDTPDGELSRQHRVLRLRRDQQVRLTYKGPRQKDIRAASRPELEFTVGDFESARLFLEALGYQVSVIYEKYRHTYRLGEVEITLDEMPFGTFTEIEGPDPESVQAAAQQLGLNWERRILESYLALFGRVKASHGLTFRDLTFENFEGVTVVAEDLGVRSADL